MSKYTAWAKDLRPLMHFETFVGKCEKLSGNSQVQVSPARAPHRLTRPCQQNKLIELRGTSASKQFDDLLAQHDKEMYGDGNELEESLEQPPEPVTNSLKSYILW